MDEVLRAALSLDDADTFFRKAAEKFAVKPLDGKPAEESGGGLATVEQSTPPGVTTQ